MPIGSPSMAKKFGNSFWKRCCENITKTGLTLAAGDKPRWKYLLIGG